MESRHKRKALTTEEALAWLKKAPRGTRFYVHFRADAVDKEGLPDLSSNVLSGSIGIARKEADYLLRNGMSPRAQAVGCRWPCVEHYYDMCGKRRVAYWIG